MDFGVCQLTIIPLRAAPSHKSEMVSQLLFGESFAIIEQQDEWLYISCSHDHYNGWIDEKQCIRMDRNTFDELNENSRHLSSETFTISKCVYKEQPILMGSPLPYFKSNEFSFFGDTYSFQGSHSSLSDVVPDEEMVKTLALKFLNTPYLWGGRSPMGADCSGFAQLVFKLLSIPLRRDSHQQADQGDLVYFIHEAKAGDLAFFDNSEGDIAHVGIMLNNKQIIHAHGRVRMDSIDQQGIFNNEQRKYTHQLRLIKRYF